jgi:hypothetical protein
MYYGRDAKSMPRRLDTFKVWLSFGVRGGALPPSYSGTILAAPCSVGGRSSVAYLA